MRILFMGTPDFARRSLEELINAGHELCGVITQPDKPVGRKRIITPSPVKVYALEKGIDVYQPLTLKDDGFRELLEKLAPELIVVVAYGRILPKYVLDFPKYRCINVHGSLLPKYRGAAPIQRAMLNGDDITGVTTMMMDEGMDTGDILLTDTLTISETENLEELYARLAELGAKLLVKTVTMLENGSIRSVKQDEAHATVAPKLTRDDEKLDFGVGTKLVMRKINCMLPSPAANTVICGKNVKIFAADGIGTVSEAQAGTVIEVTKKYFSVKTSDGAVRISELMPEGGKRMPAAAFMCGNKISVGMKVGE